MALIQCPECEGKVSDKAKACIHCGYPLHDDSPASTQFCPYCGRENNASSAFCAYCGKTLSSAALSQDALAPLEDSSSTDIMAFARQEADAAISRRQWSEPVYYQPDNQARCPKCGSTSLSVDRKGFGYGKAVAGAVIAGPIGLLAGGIGANKTMVTCMSCGHKYALEG